MSKSTKKRGQKLSQRFNKFSRNITASGEEHVKENLIERLPHARNVRLLILEWSLLTAAIIVLAVTQAFWYSNSYSVDTFTTGGTYTEATVGKVNSLNPLFATTSSEKTISKLMFATLTATDYSGHTGVGLANSITSNENGQIWTIKLRDNLKWSDGEPITSADVLFTVNLIKNSTVNTSYSTNLTGVTATVVDQFTLEFTLATPYVNFPSALNIPIVPEHILKDVKPANLLEHEFSTTKPVTSGAFTYNASQNVNTAAGEQIVYLAANPYYYGGQPLLDTFAVHALPDTDAVISALKSGTVTATAELPPTSAAAITSNAIYDKETTVNNGVYAFMNLSSTILSNKSLRQAIRQGLDMDDLRSALGDEPALNYPILESQITLNYPALPEHNLEAAREQVAAAGINGGDENAPILQVATVSTGYLPDLANNLVEQLRNMGFAAEVSVYEPSQDFLKNIIRQRNYDILIYEVELGPDPDIFAYYHSSQATASGLNLSNYRNVLADDAILAARTTMDVNLRTAKYETFLRYWVDDAPAIGIYQPNLAYFVNKNIRSFSTDNRLATATDRFADVQYWGVTKTTKSRTP